MFCKPSQMTQSTKIYDWGRELLGYLVLSDIHFRSEVGVKTSGIGCTKNCVLSLFQYEEPQEVLSSAPRMLSDSLLTGEFWASKSSILRD